MSADMYIYVLEGIGESDLESLFYNCIGSKYCPITEVSDNLSVEEIKAIMKEQDVLTEKYRDHDKLETISKIPNIWIGEVSWLKADLFDDVNRYVPSPILQIDEIIDESLPTIDNELIEKIKSALETKNTTKYKLNNKSAIIRFLKKHKGKKIFTMSC